MPSMHGNTTAGAAKDGFDASPGKNSGTGAIAAKNAGVNNYMVKPFNAQTLKAKIEEVFAEKVDFTSPHRALI